MNVATARTTHTSMSLRLKSASVTVLLSQQSSVFSRDASEDLSPGRCTGSAMYVSMKFQTATFHSSLITSVAHKHPRHV